MSLKKISKPKILVTGSSGVVGSRILNNLLDKNYDVVATANKSIPEHLETSFVRANLADARSTFELINKFRPNVVIHAAGNSNIDLCEIYQEQSWMINVVAVKNLIGLALLLGFRLIHFSSEQVYGEHPEGMKALFNEESPLNPLNFYGKSKKFAEEDIIEHLRDYVIFRLSLVYGWGSQKHFNWCDHLYEDVEDGITTKLFSDQIRSMVYVEDIPGVVGMAIENPEVSGIFNIGGSTAMLRNEFGKKFASSFNFDENLIASTSMDDFPPETPRAKNCSLNIKKAKEIFGFRPRTIDESLKDMKKNNPHIN
jgi:dTDP-4-dehydrorhamnose reductase